MPDDLVLFADDKTTLWKAHACLQERFAALRLRLHEDKTSLRHGTTSLKFLGLVLRHGGRRLQQKGIRRFHLRLLRREFREGRIDFPEIHQSLQAWQAHIKSANSERIRKALWRRVRFARKRQESALTSNSDCSKRFH